MKVHVLPCVSKYLITPDSEYLKKMEKGKESRSGTVLSTQFFFSIQELNYHSRSILSGILSKNDLWSPVTVA